MPLGSAKPDCFYDTFFTFCQSSRCRSSGIFAIAAPVSAPRCQVIHTLLEPLQPTPLIYGNSFCALKQQPLYDFPLNLALHDPALHPMCHYCISDIGIDLPKAAKRILTRTCQSPETESNLDHIISRALACTGTTMTKALPKNHYESPWPVVT